MNAVGNKPQRLSISSNLRPPQEIICYQGDERATQQKSSRVHGAQNEGRRRRRRRRREEIKWSRTVGESRHWWRPPPPPKIYGQPRFIRSLTTYPPSLPCFLLPNNIQHLAMGLICPRIHFYEINDQSW